MITYPTITPIIPKSAVDAPALIPIGQHTKLKIFPLIPVIRQIINVFINPQVYQILERNMKVVIRFPKMCMKQLCRKIADIKRQTQPFKTSNLLLAPYSSNVYTFTCSRFGAVLSNPTETSKIKSAISASVIRKVKDKTLKVGHSVKLNISQQCSS